MRIGTTVVATILAWQVMSISGARADKEANPKLVAFRLETIVMAPTKPDGSPWDGPGGRSKELFDRALGMLAKVDPRAAMFEFLSGPACAQLQKPDLYGVLEIAGGSARASQQLGLKQDEFSPTWSAGWDQLPLTSTTAIRVLLKDKDMMQDDDVGVFLLNSEDLLTALKAKHVVFIDVHEQARGALLAGISVLAEE